MKKVLIEVTELTQGGLKATQLDSDFIYDRLDPALPIPSIGDEIYAERITGKLGLVERIKNRLVEIFKKEG